MTKGSYYELHWSHHISHHQEADGLLESRMVYRRLNYSTIWENNLKVRVLVYRMFFESVTNMWSYFSHSQTIWVQESRAEVRVVFLTITPNTYSQNACFLSLQLWLLLVQRFDLL